MNARQDVLARLQRAADEVLGDEAPVLTEATPLGQDTLDSLDLIELLMIIEDQEEFVIDGEDLGEVTDVGGVVSVILARRAVDAT